MPMRPLTLKVPIHFLVNEWKERQEPYNLFRVRERKTRKQTAAGAIVHRYRTLQSSSSHYFKMRFSFNSATHAILYNALWNMTVRFTRPRDQERVSLFFNGLVSLNRSHNNKAEKGTWSCRRWQTTRPSYNLSAQTMIALYTHKL